MGVCKICGAKGALISDKIGTCLNCLRQRPEEALKVAQQLHQSSRIRYGMPISPPRSPEGILCGLCGNECRIGEGERGFCGLVTNIGGKLVRLGGTREKGILEWYYDPHVTNCVASWFCPAIGTGYPKYAYKDGPEYGYYNLAVFYGSCSFSCVFCQNYQYKKLTERLRPVMSAEELASKVNERVSCICYFGGDPSSQMEHAIVTSKIALERAKEENRILRICFETNGNMSAGFAEIAMQLVLESGGIMKFDLKFWDETLNLAMCGVSNKKSLENFRRLGEKYFDRRPEVPALTASTLLIPGYVDKEEVRKIAEFIADISPDIPYSLLAFYPCFELTDLPTTSRKQALECLNAAKEAGLKYVRIGNVHLLS